jgi:hypothetical protein
MRGLAHFGGEIRRGGFALAGHHGEQRPLAGRVAKVPPRFGCRETDFGDCVVEQLVQDLGSDGGFDFTQTGNHCEADLHVLIVGHGDEQGQQGALFVRQTQGDDGSLAGVRIFCGEGMLQNVGSQRVGCSGRLPRQRRG